MTRPAPLALPCIIPNTGNPIAFSGGEEEAGRLTLHFYAGGDEIQRLLELRGEELVVVLQESP